MNAPRGRWLWPVALAPLALAAGYRVARRIGRIGAMRGDILPREPLDTADLLLHPDGTRREIIVEGEDAAGPFLRIRHVAPPGSPLPGPHWHPVVSQIFTVEAGRARFVIAGRALIAGPGETVTVRPGQVHQFAHAAAGPLILIEEDRPPGDHRAMFAFLCRLDRAGRLNARGIPTNPLLAGLLWARMDGYIAGPPPVLQRVLFGGLAVLARRVGYADRWEDDSQMMR